MAGSFLAIGSFFSALIEKSGHQFHSFRGGLCGAGLRGDADDDQLSFGLFAGGMLSMIEQMSFLTHFESIQKGVLEFKDMAYFVILIIGWMWACTIMLDERKAS